MTISFLAPMKLVWLLFLIVNLLADRSLYLTPTGHNDGISSFLHSQFDEPAYAAQQKFLCESKEVLGISEALKGLIT